MTSSPLARMGAFGSAAMALALALLLGSCSNNVSGPTPVEDPARVTIQPDTAVLYSGLPTTFTVSGGTGTYSISSSNQAVVQVPDFLNGRTFQVTPANVVADTAVTITVRDSGTAPLATASLTVRPGTVANEITVTPTATQGGSCAPAVCSGGDAIVFATVSQGGNPLPARGVRLDVVSGDFRFITSAPGQPEVLATTATVVSDQAGGVLARIRVLPGAPNQTAVLQVTDLGTNAFQRATFTIAQATGSSPGFFTIPDAVAFSGPNNLSCALGTRADVTVFGGSPPYTVGSAGSAFGVSRNSIPASGESFYVVANGICTDGVALPIVDSSGRTASVTLSNVLGTTTIPDLELSPDEVTLSSCGALAAVSVAGGIPGTFTVTSGSTGITVVTDLNRRTIAISRTPDTPVTSPVFVGVTSGDKSAQVEVNVTGDALNTRCDSSSLRLTPSSVTLASCDPVTVAITAGAPPYSVLSDNSSVTVSTSTVATSGGTFNVRRTPGSGAGFTTGAVVVTDTAGAIRTLPITGTGAGSLPCP